MLKDILIRIDQRLAKLGLTDRAASLATGKGADLIRDLRRAASGKKSQSGMRLSTIDALAPVLATSARWLLEGEGPEERDGSGGTIREVPIVSWVKAGAPTLAADRIADWPTVPTANLPEGQWIALEVVGDSMDRVAPEGAIIFVNMVERQPVHRGLYVCEIAGETTFKRFLAGATPMLQPVSTNPDHAPILVTPRTRFIGRVRRSVKDW